MPQETLTPEEERFQKFLDQQIYGNEMPEKLIPQADKPPEPAPSSKLSQYVQPSRMVAQRPATMLERGMGAKGPSEDVEAVKAQGGRLANMVMGAQAGSAMGGALMGPAGSMAGGLLGGGLAAIPEPDAVAPNLAAWGTEMLFNKFGPLSQKLIAIPGKTLLEAATVTAAASAAGGQDAGLLEGGMNLVGAGLGRLGTMFGRRGKDMIDISDTGSRAGSRLAKIEAMSPDELIADLRNRGFDLPTDIFSEAGDPASRKEWGKIIAGASPSSRNMMNNAALGLDSSMTRMFRKMMGEEVPIEDLQGAIERLKDFRIRGNISDQTISIQKQLMNPKAPGGVTWRTVKKFTSDEFPPNEVQEFEKFLKTRVAPEKFVNATAALFSPDRNAKLSSIRAMTSVMEAIDPAALEVYRRAAINQIFDTAQAGVKGARKESVTLGREFANTINTYSPEKLEALFGEDGAAAAKILSKAFANLDPSDFIANTDLVMFTYGANKAVFTGSSAAATGEVGSALGNLAKSTVGALVMATSLSEFMAKAITNPTMAKNIVAMSSGDKTAIKTFTRALVAEALINGSISKDTETGVTIITPGGKEERRTPPASAALPNFFAPR